MSRRATALSREPCIHHRLTFVGKCRSAARDSQPATRNQPLATRNLPALLRPTRRRLRAPFCGDEMVTTITVDVYEDEPREVITVQEDREPATTRAPALPGSEYYKLTLDDFESP